MLKYGLIHSLPISFISIFTSDTPFSLLSLDGIMGQVSPEGLLSRLQAEGANTEAESEVSGFSSLLILYGYINICHLAPDLNLWILMIFHQFIWLYTPSVVPV